MRLTVESVLKLGNLFKHIAYDLVCIYAHVWAYLAPFVARIDDSLVKIVLLVVVKVPDFGLYPSVVGVAWIVNVTFVDHGGNEAQIVQHIGHLRLVGRLKLQAVVLSGERGKKAHHVFFKKVGALLHIGLFEDHLHKCATHDAVLGLVSENLVARYASQTGRCVLDGNKLQELTSLNKYRPILLLFPSFEKNSKESLTLFSVESISKLEI